jgi:hypothetical protein
MRYQYKLALFWILEFTPFTDKLYWIIQRYILRSQRINSQDLEHCQDLCNKHVHSYLRFHSSNPVDIHEFGAGWILYSPLIFGARGFNVTASDLKELARRNLNTKLAQTLG